MQSETCIEPLRVDGRALHDAGYSAEEIRVEFQRYFQEAEEFLNCWNQVTYRVHEEVRAATHEFGEALRLYPLEHGGLALDAEGAVSEASDEMVDTGRLIMSFGGRAFDE